MKKIVTLLFVLLVGFALVAGSVAAPGNAWASALESGFLQIGTLNLHLPLLVNNSVANTNALINQPVDCGLRPITHNLVTATGSVAGEVSMHHDNDFLYVEITAAAGQCLAGIQMHVATELAGIPQADGAPLPEQFEFQVTLNECSASYTFALPMRAEWGKASSLVVAVHVNTTEQQTGAQMSSWGDCTPFSGDPAARYCSYLKAQTKIIPYNVSVGYEDLDLTSRYTDFDYNDWVTDIAGSLRYCQTEAQGFVLWQVDLDVTPQARGAGLDHAYHIDFPANIFPSDGTAILTRYDQNGNVIGVPLELPFIADQLNQYDMVDPTSNALPGAIVNTVESKAHQPTLGTAILRLEFDNPFFFDVTPYLPILEENIHGERLFFQPHLFVYQDPAYEIGPGNPLMLVVPFLTWHWPEERINIWNAYPNVTPGDTAATPKVPPQFTSGWFDNFNDCVYNGVPCTAPVTGASAPTLLPYPAP